MVIKGMLFRASLSEGINEMFKIMKIHHCSLRVIPLDKKKNVERGNGSLTRITSVVSHGTKDLQLPIRQEKEELLVSLVALSSPPYLSRIAA